MSARALLAAALLLSLAVSAHAGPLFRAPSLVADTRDPPLSVATADLDGDARLDLAVVVSGGVSVFRGNGDGTFGTRTDLETGSVPRSVAIADLDADGRPDLVTANPGSYPGSYPYIASSVTVLLGLGDGTFRPRAVYEGGSFARSIAITDLNGDGRLDLAVANFLSVSVLLGRGDGTFADRTQFAAEGASSVAVGDLNGDGRPDLVTANNYANPDDGCPDRCAVSVLLGNGDGTFGPSNGFGTGYMCGAVAIGEFNRDGRPDVVVANSHDRSTTVSVLLGNGDGTLGNQREFFTGATPVSVAIADLNGDGRPDLAVANAGGDPDFDSNTVSVLLGNGYGSFRTAGEFNVGENPGSLAVGDLDADGHLDLAVANGQSRTVSVLLGNGDGTLGTTDIHTAGYAQSVAIADLDADGRTDLAVPNNGPYPGYTGVVSVLLGNRDGTFRAGGNFAIGSGAGSVAIADLDADGKPDLVVTNVGLHPDFAGRVSVLLGNGDGTFPARTDYGTGIFSNSVAIADLNRDGKPDLAVGNSGASPYYVGTVSVLLGNGDGTFAARSDFAAGLQPLSVAIADLDADGGPDLVVANPPSNTVSVLRGNGDGTFGIGAAFLSGPWPASVAIADLDADGWLDLAVGSTPGSILLGNGNGTFGASSEFDGGDRLSSVAIADFDADGRLDLAVANEDLAGTVSVLLGIGDGTFGARTVFGTGWHPRSLALGDLNADGKPDLAVANPNSKTISVLLGTADAPTPVQMSLVSSETTRERVVLRWWGEGAGSLGACVYRRTDASDWERLGDAIAEGADLVRYEDRAVAPGARYAYRLGYPDGAAESFTDAVWVDVPTALRLALEGFRPNPAFGAAEMAFTLADGSPATIEVLDMAGRRVLRREVGGLGAGNHVIRLDAGARLALGAYLMRLRQAGRTMSARGVVVR